MNSFENQCSIAVFACFDNINARFKYSIDELKYFNLIDRAKNYADYSAEKKKCEEAKSIAGGPNDISPAEEKKSNLPGVDEAPSKPTSNKIILRKSSAQ